MTCNIAVTGIGFAAVAADTRIVLQHVDGRQIPLDTKESFESTEFPWPYPTPMLKIVNIGDSWATVCGDVFCGVPALELLNDRGAESCQDACRTLSIFDSLNILMPSGSPITPSQKAETQIFGAPFLPDRAPVWHQTLNPADQRNGREYSSVIQWGAAVAPSDEADYRRSLETLMTNRPSVYEVARLMGSIIAVATTLSASVSPYIQFGATFTTPNGSVEKLLFSGLAADLVQLTESAFFDRIQRIS